MNKLNRNKKIAILLVLFVIESLAYCEQSSLNDIEKLTNSEDFYENNIFEDKTSEYKKLGSGSSSKTSITGYYEIRNYFDRNKDNNRESYYDLRQNLRLEISRQLFDLQYLISLNAEYDLIRNKQEHFSSQEDKVQLWECYINWVYNKLNIRLGKQVIRWGKSDEINPTDNFTPEDWSEFINLTRAERKLPVWMLKMDYYAVPYRIQMIWLPFFVPSRIPETGSDWEPYLYRSYRNNIIPFQVKRPQRPAKNIKNSVVAIKVVKSTARYDCSLSYAYHFDQLPSLYVDSSTLEVNQLYHREHSFGADFETTFRKLGLRGEMVYIIHDLFVTYSPSRPDKVVAKDVLRTILGLDYTFKNNIYINLQYLFEMIMNHEEGMFNRPYQDSIIWKLSRKFLHDNLLLELSGRVYLFDLDLYYKLNCEYNISDNLKVNIGYEYFLGEEDATFGQYNINDQFFLKFKYFW